MKLVEKVKCITERAQGKPGGKAFDKKCAWVARVIDTLQASSKIDVDYIKVNRFT